MNAKEFVQIVKKMFSKGLTPEEKIKLADEGPVCRLLLRQWDKFFGTSMDQHYGCMLESQTCKEKIVRL